MRCDPADRSAALATLFVQDGSEAGSLFSPRSVGQCVVCFQVGLAFGSLVNPERPILQFSPVGFAFGDASIILSIRWFLLSPGLGLWRCCCGCRRRMEDGRAFENTKRQESRRDLKYSEPAIMHHEITRRPL